MSVEWMKEWINEWIKGWINILSPLPFCDFTWNPYSPNMNDLFYFSVLPMGLWPRQSTTLATVFVALWDQESKMEGKKLLKWWKEDTRPWNRVEGIITLTPWIPAVEDTWRWTTPDTITQTGIVSHSPVFMKWVSLSYLTLQFKCPSSEH